jgi:uncharacterized protein
MVAQANRDEPLDPAFRVTLNPPSATLPTEPTVAQDVLQWITSVSVHDQLNDPSTFELQLIDQDAMDGGNHWADDDRFVIGAHVGVSLGYGSRLESLIVGEITSLAAGFSSAGLPTLTVQGADLRHRLNGPRRTNTWVARRKISALVKEICAAQNIEIDGLDSTVEVDRSMVQFNLTDLQFVKRCAERLLYELVMEGRTLHFQPINTRAPKVATLSLDDDLLELNPVLSLLPLTRFELRSYDAETKLPMRASAGADTAAGMGGTQTAAETTRRVLGESTEIESAVTVGGQAELDQFARARFESAALNYVTGSGRCRGRTDVRAGKIIGIDGLGKRFSGDYRIGSAVHSYQRGGDYVTTFQVERNAS